VINPPTPDAEFVRLFSQHARRIYAYLYLLLNNAVDTDDVFQETSRALWENFTQFTPGTNFAAWAERVAHFQVLTFRKRRQRDRLQFSDEFVAAVSLRREEMLESLELRRAALDGCLEKLRDPDRQLLQLRYADGGTVIDADRLVGRSVDAVYKALNRIETMLVECTQRALRRDPGSSAAALG
jgi:RNA polymerase sigma-70 factor (ECF subfamily)